MRRADRLFRLVGQLQRRRVITAATLARRLEVSERTVYRDIADLIGSGVPIQGAAGVGYRLESGFDLPPLMFSEVEIEAIVLGSRLVRAFGDPGLGRAAEDVLSKIRRVLPDKLVSRIEDTRLYGHSFQAQAQVAERLASLREALRQSRKITLVYDDAKGATSTRVLRPLGLFFVGHAWLLAAWCELRGDFRTFRLDRIADIVVLSEPFVSEPGKRFEDFLESVR